MAIQLLIAAKKDHFAGPVAADDVALRLGAQHAGIGQQQHRVGWRLRAMPAEKIQAGREAQGMRAAHLQLHAPTDLDAAAVGQQLRRRDRPAAHADLAEGIDQVAFAVAADTGVPRGNVGQDGDVGPAPITRLADDQFVGQADPIPAHGIDPKHEPIRGFGSRAMVISPRIRWANENMVTWIGDRGTGLRTQYSVLSTQYSVSLLLFCDGHRLGVRLLARQSSRRPGRRCSAEWPCPGEFRPGTRFPH